MAVGSSTFGGFGKFAAVFTKWGIKDKRTKEDERFIEKQSLIAVEPDDGSQMLDTSHYAATGLSIDGTFQTQAALINEYRAMALHSDVDSAIDDIVNAVVVSDEDETAVELDLEDVDIGENIKEKVVEEFDNILEMMDFDNVAYEKLRQWYVDGRIFYQVVVDENNLSKGILRLINLDPRAIRKIREIEKAIDPNTRIEKIIRTESYFMYDTSWAMSGNNQVGGSGNPTNSQLLQASIVRPGQAVKMSEDSIAMSHSGWTNVDGNMILSYLEKARKPLNNLKMMEDALVVYRITRAPERRVFYVDVGTLPTKSAMEYMNTVLNKYKTKMSYDPVSGNVNGQAYQISLMEDYWLPRREGGRGTEIDTLPGGENLGAIDDILYFQKKLNSSLNVPRTRLEGESPVLIGGRGPEITRDEWKFDKFVRRLRKRFSMLFLDLLRKQLCMKRITTPEDWDKFFSNKVKFKYRSDTYMKEQQEIEAMEGMMATLQMALPYEGKFFSRDWIQRNVLKRTDEQIEEQQKKIDEEIKAGVYPDPMAQPDDEGNAPSFFGYS